MSHFEAPEFYFRAQLDFGISWLISMRIIQNRMTDAEDNLKSKERFKMCHDVCGVALWVDPMEVVCDGRLLGIMFLHLLLA